MGSREYIEQRTAWIAGQENALATQLKPCQVLARHKKIGQVLLEGVDRAAGISPGHSPGKSEELICSNRQAGLGENGNSRAAYKNLGDRGRHFLCPLAIMAEQDRPHEAKYQAEG
jgi:hypothetical protein